MTKKSGDSGATTQTTENSGPGPETSEKPRGLKILLAMPCHGSPTTGCVVSVARAMTHFASLHYDGDKTVDLTVVKSSILPEGRTRLVSRAYELEATHILWVDSDMKFPPDTITRLLNHNKPVVAANYPRKNFTEPRPTAYADNPEYVGPVWSGSLASGLQQVQVAGMGLMLTDLKVFDELSPPFFKFDPLPPDFIKQSGEDVWFCQLLHKAGIPVFIDHDLSKEVAHIGEFEFTNMLAKEAEVVKQALYHDLAV